MDSCKPADIGRRPGCTVYRIVDSDVREVAAVDQPATGRRWRFFGAPATTTSRAPVRAPAGGAPAQIDEWIQVLSKAIAAGARLPSAKRVGLDLGPAGALASQRVRARAQQRMAQRGGR
jgi:hypothetical protein